jgi:hypothetical protein
MKIKFHVNNQLNKSKINSFYCLDWLIERCLQVYLSNLSQSSLYLRLQKKMFTKQIEQLVDIHTHLISKKIFSHNWTK